MSIPRQLQSLPQLPHHTPTPVRGWFSWVWDIFSHLGISDPIQTDPFKNVRVLESNVDANVFVQHISDMNHLYSLAEKEITSIDTSSDAALRLGYRKLLVIGKMEIQAKGWKEQHKEYDYQEINTTFTKVAALKKTLARKTPKASYKLPKGGAVEKSLPLPSPGLVNGNNICYMNTLLQMVLGDPILTEHIVNGKVIKKETQFIEGSEQEVEIDVETKKHYADVMDTLKGCALEFQKARREGKTDQPLSFTRDVLEKLHVLSPESNFKNFDKQQDAEEALRILTSPLELMNNPLFPKRVEMITRGLSMTQGNITAEMPIIHLNDEEVKSKAKSLALESYIEKSLVDTDFSGMGDITGKESKFCKCPEYLLMPLNRNTKDPAIKVNKKIFLEETFYLDPKHVMTGEGGKFEVRSFAVHRGDSANSGHYIAYRREVDGWREYSDTNIKKIHLNEVRKKLQVCSLIFAKKSDEEMTPEEISLAIKNQINLANAMEKDLGLLDMAWQLWGNERESKLINAFKIELEQEKPSPDHLNLILSAFNNDSFKSSMVDILRIENKDVSDIKNLPLLALKEIDKPYLTNKVRGNIVAQYEYIKEKRWEQVREVELIKTEEIVSSALGNDYALAQQDKLIFENTCIEHLQTLNDLNEEHLPCLIKILAPSLTLKYESIKNQESQAEQSARSILDQIKTENEKKIQKTIAILAKIASFEEALAKDIAALQAPRDQSSKSSDDSAHSSDEPSEDTNEIVVS